MLFQMYSVKDIVSAQFSNVEMFANEQVAKRWFNNLLKESKIASDLQLYKVGTFNIQSGEVIADFEFVQGGVLNE